MHPDGNLSLPTERLSFTRRALRLVGSTWTALILAALAATVTAQIVRDRRLSLALLMYVPIWPIALSAIVRDGLARGRALPVRWSLLTLGVGAGAYAVSLLWCPTRAPEGNVESPPVTVVQWNMQWGGARGAESSADMMAHLDTYQPDVVCVSEAPVGLGQTRAREGMNASSWQVASVEHSPPSTYWFRMTVLSREPVAVRQRWDLRAGHAALFEVALKPRTLRILMVDLQSHPFVPRSPTIAEMAHLVDELAAAGTPIDIVTGDFNTPGHFLGFDALTDAADGYRRAAMWSGQWRATWPAHVPLSPFDIDHLWVKRGVDIASAHLFSNPNTDHRGQAAVLRLPYLGNRPYLGNNVEDENH